MIVTTTGLIEGRPLRSPLGVVSGRSGVALDNQAMGDGGGMILVAASGTAVRLAR